MSSAFIRRLEAYGIKQPCLCGAEGVFGIPIRFEKNAHLFREGWAPDQILFVDSGWLTTQEFQEDGGVFHRALYVPGDIAGLTELAWAPASTDLVALTSGTARRLARPEFNDLTRRHPGFASLVLTMSVVQQTALSDRHAHALTSDGRGRLLYFLLDLHARQTIITSRDWIDLPLTQMQIANSVGLSNVHVNVLLRSLEEEDVLKRERGRLRFTDLTALRQEINYRERWSNIDFGWVRSFRALESPFAA